MKMIKPDLKIFETVIKNEKLNPEKTLFIEDSKENADAARTTGINTLVIERNSNFYDYLQL